MVLAVPVLMVLKDPIELAFGVTLAPFLFQKNYRPGLYLGLRNHLD